MKLKHKYALIVTTTNGGTSAVKIKPKFEIIFWFQTYEVFFKEKNLERILELVFGILGNRPLTNAERDEILVVGEERRAEIIADAFLERFRMMQPQNIVHGHVHLY